jgi:hypothetical protein
MRIEPAGFLALTAAMAACHRSEVPAGRERADGGSAVTACLDDWVSIWSY